MATDHGGLFLDQAGGQLEAADMPDGEPAINFDDLTTSDSPRQMFVASQADGSYITFVQESASSTFFGVSVTSDGVVTYCSGDTQGECDDGADAAQVWTTAW